MHRRAAQLRKTAAELATLGFEVPALLPLRIRFGLGGPEQRTKAFVRLRHLVLTIRTPPAMRILTLLAFSWLIANVPTVMAQGTGAGGASSSGGSARGGGGTGGPAAIAPSTAAPTSPSVNAPAVPAPSVGNTQVNSGRSVDANPPTRPTGPATSAPAPRVEQPGVSTGAGSGKAASRPGAAQSPNSDGYAECMAMSPADSDTSRESWSATCDRARLPRKSP